jgi:phosphoribosylaminoimidazole-succinocarboxamide synthase
MNELLNENQARDLVSDYMEKQGASTPTQEILDSGAVPRLEGYIVKDGKVSDSIFGGYEDNSDLETKDGVPLRLMVRTERISTHDKNRGEIPFKDQILASNHHFMRGLVQDVMGTSQYDVEGLDDTSVVIVAENLQTIPVENVMRAYMAKSTTETSLYQSFMRGERDFCGHELPEDLVANGKLPYVMDTPSTKSDTHDKSVSPEWLMDSRTCTPAQYNQIRNVGLVGFGIVSGFLAKRGLILVDTKTEHGVDSNYNIVSQDELFTLDSSRFWLASDYLNQLEQAQAGKITELQPKSFSKEFARGFSKGDEGYTEDQRAEIAVRYIMGIQHLLGKKFEPDMRPRDERVVSGLQSVVDKLAD